ncbi:MAG: glutamate racemase [Clostridia bacterium]
MDNRPIGVFDSGLGGLTAAREIMNILPGEDIIYFGDTGRVPYGARSSETIIKYTRQDIRFLKQFDIKTLVIACGTASAVALETVRDDYGIPIIGVVEPAAKAAACATKNRKIGIIGTKATIGSGAYGRAIRAIDDGIETFANACPLFVPLVENGRIETSDAILKIAVEEYLEPLRTAQVDTLILGCTHYPIIAKAIAEYMGYAVTLINPGYEAAHHLEGIMQTGGKKNGVYKFFVSDDIESFSEQASVFLGHSVSGSVELINIDAV